MRRKINLKNTVSTFLEIEPQLSRKYASCSKMFGSWRNILEEGLIEGTISPPPHGNSVSREILLLSETPFST